MARYVCLSGIANGSDSEVNKLKGFDYEGYKFSPAQSSEDNFVFTRSAAEAATNKPGTGTSRKRKNVLVENISKEAARGEMQKNEQESAIEEGARRLGTRSSKRGKHKK